MYTVKRKVSLVMRNLFRNAFGGGNRGKVRDIVRLAAKKSVFTFAEGATHVAHSDKFRRVAFTLAEVLITLGIIGVVAAITLPTVITNYQKKVAAERAKQTYSILTQTFERAKVDYGDIENWDINSPNSSNNEQNNEIAITTFAEKYMEPYLNLAEKPKFTQIKDYGYEAFYTKAKQIYWPKYNKAYIIPLSNGVVLFVALDGNYKIIFADINGSAPPNMAGRDIYLFSFSLGKLRLYGDTLDINRLKAYCRPIVQANTYDNFYCTALLAKNGWVIDKNYPW